MDASILISSHNRLNLFRRTLYSIDKNRPDCDFEVIVVDDGSTDDIVAELRNFSFKWKFLSVDMRVFAKATGYTHFWNCPALTNNIAFKISKGKYIFECGNEIIVYQDALNELLVDIPKTKYAWCVSHTIDMPQSELDLLDKYGTNITDETVSKFADRVLSNSNNAPNYLSVFTREVWDELEGYDERYVAGISCEDSDFMRRFFAIPGNWYRRSDALSIHQYHGGVSHLYRPLPSVISEEKLTEGVAINRKLFNTWDGSIKNQQPWKWGTIGYNLEDIIQANY